jgi:hypothetical protein
VGDVIFRDINSPGSSIHNILQGSSQPPLISGLISSSFYSQQCSGPCLSIGSFSACTLLFHPMAIKPPTLDIRFNLQQVHMDLLRVTSDAEGSILTFLCSLLKAQSNELTRGPPGLVQHFRF